MAQPCLVPRAFAIPGMASRRAGSNCQRGKREVFDDTSTAITLPSRIHLRIVAASTATKRAACATESMSLAPARSPLAFEEALTNALVGIELAYPLELETPAAGTADRAVDLGLTRTTSSLFVGTA